MKELMKHVEVGQDYTYLDGHTIPVYGGAFKFEGLFARHEFTEPPPQITAIASPDKMSKTLSNRDYWYERQIGEMSPENCSSSMNCKATRH